MNKMEIYNLFTINTSFRFYKQNTLDAQIAQDISFDKYKIW